MNSEKSIQIRSRKSLQNELQNDFETSMNQLEIFWKELGISHEQVADRSDTVLVHVRNLLNDLVKEEEELVTNIKNRIKKHENELNKLCSELDEEFKDDYKDLSLLQKENFLKIHLEALRTKKKDRMEKYKQLRKNESRLCTTLGMSESLLFFSFVPKENELQGLEKRVHFLADERERRYHKYCQAKHRLTTILEETNISPNTSFVKEVISHDNELDLVLSEEKLDQLKEVLEKVQNLKKEMIEEVQSLTVKLDNIWNLVDVDLKTRDEFKKNYSETRRSTVLAMKREIRRCEDIRKQNIMNVISKLREELVILWEKCYISEAERHKFEPFYSGDYTEDLLMLHETEVSRLKKFYKNAENIFDKIKMRYELWKKMLAFEKKAKDPNRFINRGGNLLQEERERNKLLKDLPKLEEEILNDIEEYEKENVSPILVNGISFVEFMKQEWEEHQKEKENERLERQKQRAVTPGLMSNFTPGKRPLLSTPASAPCKLLCTGRGLLATCQPDKQSITPKTPKFQPSSLKKSKTSIKKKRVPFTRSQILKQNYATNKKMPSNSEKNNNTTLYADFAKELDKTCRERYRSSTKHKVHGSKINHNGSLKKSQHFSNNSFSKSKTRSIINGLKSPIKITPVRGKLGLPFLI